MQQSETLSRVSDIEKKLEELKQKRDKYVGYAGKFLLVCILVIIAASIMLGVLKEQSEMTSFLGGVVGAVGYITIPGFLILLSMAGKKRKEFTKIYKENFVIAVLEEKLENVEYNWLSGFTKEEIKQKGFVYMGAGFYSEDCLNAEYKGVKFKRADVSIKNSNTDKEFIFRGQVYEIDFNKEILTGMQILGKNFSYSETPGYLRKCKVIETESVNFNEKFEIRALDTQEAFYVLTPQMMEYILKLNENYDSMCIIIEGTKMTLAANTGMDSFEVYDLKDSVNYETAKNEIIGEIDSIKLIIDELRIDDRKYVENIADNKSFNTSMNSLN